jgi:hypothetical protein
VTHRGRRPPPGFRQWFELAQTKSAVVVETFWDQIYEDLEPFWSISTKEIRRLSFVLAHTAGQIERVYGIWIRNQTVHTNYLDDDWSCSGLVEFVRDFEHLLPDLDIPYKGHLSPRVFPLWEDIRELRSHARQTRRVIDRNNMTGVYGSIEHLDPSQVQKVLSRIKWDEKTPVSSVVPRNCPPGTGTRTLKAEKDNLDLSLSETYTTDGFVSNFQSSKNVCLQPDLLYNHGIFVSPPILMTTEALLPLFSQSPLSGINSEITIPASIYHQDDPKYWSSNLRSAWSDKKALAFWRGINSGGKHTASNWKGFHRHRFVASMNGTYIQRMAQGEDPFWTIPNVGLSNVSSFLESHTDVGFSGFICADSRWCEETQSCSYLN